MTVLPASGYWENNARTEGEGKQWGEDIRDVIAELLGGSAASMLTIASGVIVPTTANHTVEGEGAASDDLTNITTTNTPDGRLLLLVAYNAAHVITVKDAAGGAGQIHLLGNADYDLDATDKWILLKRAGTDWYEIFRSHHGIEHERAGVDEVDGDHLDIDWNPSHYIPATTPSEAANVDDLTAHLYGIDQMFLHFAKGYFRRSKFTYNGGATAYTIKCEPAVYWCKDKLCQWVTELTTTAIGSPIANTTYYLYLDYSEITHGTAIIAAKLIWSTTVPTWNDTYMGRYNGDDLCIMAVRTNSAPDNIWYFDHDGGDHIHNGVGTSDQGASDPGTDFSTEVTLTVPAFVRRAEVEFFMEFVDGAPGRGRWRNTDDTAGAGQNIGIVEAGVTRSTLITDVFCNAALKIDIAVTAGSNDKLGVNTWGWYFPVGM